MENIKQVFKAMADETRIKILMIISNRTICQKGISKQLQISDSAVSQHIKILKDANILIGQKEGYFVFYQINKEVFKECINFMEYLSGDIIYSVYDEKEIISNCNVPCRGNKKCCKKREE